MFIKFVRKGKYARFSLLVCIAITVLLSGCILKLDPDPVTEPDPDPIEGHDVLWEEDFEASRFFDSTGDIIDGSDSPDNYWRFTPRGTGGTATLSWETNDVVSGNYSAKVEVTGGTRNSDCLLVDSSNAVVNNLLSLSAGDQITIVFWAKTPAGIAESAGAVVRIYDTGTKDILTPFIQTDGNWERYAFAVEIPSGWARYLFYLMFQNVEGSILYDDIKIVDGFILDMEDRELRLLETM